MGVGLVAVLPPAGKPHKVPAPNSVVENEIRAGLALIVGGVHAHDQIKVLGAGGEDGHLGGIAKTDDSGIGRCAADRSRQDHGAVREIGGRVNHMRHGAREDGLAVFIQFRKLAGRLRKDEQRGDQQQDDDGERCGFLVHVYLFSGAEARVFMSV